MFMTEAILFIRLWLPGAIYLRSNLEFKSEHNPLMDIFIYIQVFEIILPVHCINSQINPKL